MLSVDSRGPRSQEGMTGAGAAGCRWPHRGAQVTETPVDVLNRGPDYFRRRIFDRDSGFERVKRRSAVELLEASKHLYVKSELVLDTKQPVPIVGREAQPSHETCEGRVKTTPRTRRRTSSRQLSGSGSGSSGCGVGGRGGSGNNSSSSSSGGGAGGGVTVGHSTVERLVSAHSSSPCAQLHQLTAQTGYPLLAPSDASNQCFHAHSDHPPCDCPPRSPYQSRNFPPSCHRPLPTRNTFLSHLPCQQCQQNHRCKTENRKLYNVNDETDNDNDLGTGRNNNTDIVNCPAHAGSRAQGRLGDLTTGTSCVNNRWASDFAARCYDRPANHNVCLAQLDMERGTFGKATDNDSGRHAEIPTIAAGDWRDGQTDLSLEADQQSSGTCSSSQLAKIEADTSSAAVIVRRRKKEGKKVISRSRSDLTKRFSNSSELSELSARFSRNSADLEKFFNDMGLDRTVLQPLMHAHGAHAQSSSSLNVFDSISSVGSPDTRSWNSDDSQKSDLGLKSADVEDRTSGSVSSVVERNARIIKWLCSVKKAGSRGPPPDTD